MMKNSSCVEIMFSDVEGYVTISPSIATQLRHGG